MKAAVLAAAALVVTPLSGCAGVKENYSADGRKAYALNCSGTARGWDKCFAAAGEICGARGYDVIDRTSEDTAAVDGGSGNFFGTKTNERSMLVACKK
jgi:hypothetical protein